MSIEILAPAGSPEMLTAAVRAGADAVYFGMGKFNARRNAKNFTLDNVGGYVDYCRRLGVKTYLTLNTLVSDNELSKALKIARLANDIGVDAVLVQDMGLAALLKHHLPDLPLHASTQMAIHNISGLEFASKLGFVRVVLARENSKQEIAQICERAKQLGVEIEVFVQGALCMCVSGQCLMSASLGGRSGNRGLCAGTCRLPFAVKGSECVYGLSLKDLSLLDRFDELEQLGVKSFKIEGRMKRPEYTAAAVAAAVAARDDKDNLPSRLEVLKSVFSRDGFTSAYYDGKLTADMFGVRKESDIESAKRVYSAIHEIYRTDPARVPLNISFTAKKGECEELTVSDGKNTVTIQGDIPSIADYSQTVVDQLRVKLSKLGGTGYHANSVNITLDDGLRVTDINTMKADALTALTKARTAPVQRRVVDYAEKKRPLREIRTAKTVLNFHSAQQIPSNLSGVDAVMLPLFTDDKTLCDLAERINIIIKTPPVVFDEVKIKKRLNEIRGLGVKSALAENIGSVKMIADAGLEPVGGATLNCFNSLAAAGYGLNSFIVSRETSLQALRYMESSARMGVEIYGKTPMMTVRSCPIRARVGCAKCLNYITDRRGVHLPVMCEDSVTRIYNDRPTWLCDRTDIRELADFVVLSFTDETSDRVREIVDCAINCSPPDCEFTRGMLINKVK